MATYRAMRRALVCGSLVMFGCSSPEPATPSDASVEAGADARVEADVDRPAPTDARTRGLTLVTAEPVSPTWSGTAHLARLLVRAGRVYGANSSAGLMTWEIDREGRLAPRSSTEPLGPGPTPTGPSTLPRCVAVALDASGRWLYCSAADAGIARFDLRDPNEPAVVDRGALLPEEGLGYPDLHVADGELLVAAFGRGLLRATPDADGRLGPLQPTGVTGDVVSVDGGGSDALAALDRRRGLVHLARSAGALQERGALALDGPPLGLRIHGTLAAVAMGSSGVILADLSSDPPRVVRRVTPPCVATRADFTDTALAVACSTGVWLYDLRAAEPRVADFDAAQYGALDVTFTDAGRRLIAADWRTLLVYTVDPAGHAHLPDVSSGAYLRPGDGATVAARNPGDVPLTLTFSRLVEGPMGVQLIELQRAAAAPGELVRFSVTGAQLATWLDPAQRSAQFQVIAEESRAWRRFHQGSVRFLTVDRSPSGEHPPAEGEAFPRWTARAGAQGPAALPPAGASDIALLLPDCALQWGAIEDLAWQQRHGRLLPARQLLMLSISFGDDLDETERGQTLRRLDAAELGAYPLSDYLGAVAGGRSSGAFADAQLSSRLTGGGDYTEVFQLDAQGVVQHTERIYRGAWPLR